MRGVIIRACYHIIRLNKQSALFLIHKSYYLVSSYKTSFKRQVMGQEKKNLIFFVVILVCILITQGIAYFATSSRYILNFLALYTILIQWISFIYAGGFFGNDRTEKYYDLTGSLTFLTTLALSLYNANGKLNTRQMLLNSLVAIWSVRLGWFLFNRIRNNNGIDSRFIPIKQSRPRFWMAWTLQGLWVFTTVLPVLIVNMSSEINDFSSLDYTGILFWIFGFCIEVIADYQKDTWQKLVKNKNKFINAGLWTISRHPNYFGEIVLWTGISLSAFSGSSGPRSFLIYLSPIFVVFLLLFISGIPSLEKKGDQKFGRDHAYQRYKKSTPVLIPFIGRTGDARF